MENEYMRQNDPRPAAELPATQLKLLESGRRWFLEKGYKDAPLRKIVADAGFTLGAFYGYYKTKADLFYHLTDEAAEHMAAILTGFRLALEEYPKDERPYHISECFEGIMPEFVNYAAAHPDEIRLLMHGAAGTRYEDLFEKLLAVDYDSGAELMQTSVDFSALSSLSTKTLIEGFFSMILNIVLSGASRVKMLRSCRDVLKLYRVGMEGLLESDF